MAGTITEIDPRERARARFVADTAEHEMAVLRDDGLYRHIRLQRPGTAMYHVDLITWPGHLVVTGDCGTFTFARTRDMFEFFEASPEGINPGYWCEKLLAPSPHHVDSVFSRARFRLLVSEWITEQEDEEVKEAARERLLEAEVHSNHDAHELLRDFEHNGVLIHDSWEWSFGEFDYQFLWCCWAIREGIRRYRAHAAGAAAGAQPEAEPAA